MHRRSTRPFLSDGMPPAPRPRQSGTENLTNILRQITKMQSPNVFLSMQKLAFTMLLIRGFVTAIERFQVGVAADNIIRSFLLNLFSKDLTAFCVNIHRQLRVSKWRCVVIVVLQRLFC